MRAKLNENPVAQIALVAILVVVGGYLLLSTMGGESSGAETAATSTEAGVAPVEGEATAVEGAGPEEGSALEGATPVSATSAISAPAGRPLPSDVEQAYAENKTVVLLIYRKGGVDDRLVGLASDVLRGNPRVALFDAPTKEIARYAAITGPLGVNQAPALIVISPKKIAGGAPAPATVTYGFQSSADIIQAVVDAGYQGPQLTYAPN